MAAQKGRDLLVKIDSTGTGTYVTVAGLRTRTLAFNAATVDMTNSESTGLWRELLAGAGLFLRQLRERRQDRVRAARAEGAGRCSDNGRSG